MIRSTDTKRSTNPAGVSSNTATFVMVRGVFAWKRFVRACAQVAREAWDSVSAVGWCVLVTAALGLGLGLGFGWAEATVAGIIASVLILCAFPYLFGVNAYQVELSLDHSRIVVGDEAGGSILVTNVSRRLALPGVIDLPIGQGIIECDVPMLRRSAVHDHPVMIPGEHRSVMRVGPARSVRRDPLGMFRRERVWQNAETLFIHPRTTPLPSMSSGLIRDLEGQPSSVIVPDDLSFHAIREYQAGDSRRQVHWKSTAKTGQLMVRQYEETRRSGISIVLGSRESEFRDADEFELAVGVAASLGVRAIRDGRDVDFTISEEVPEFAREVVGRVSSLPARTPTMLLDHLSSIDVHPRMHTLPETARLTAAHLQAASLAFLVCGSSLDVVDLRRAALAFPPHVAVVAVVCDRHAEPASWMMGDTTVMSVGILDDIGQLLIRGPRA